MELSKQRLPQVEWFAAAQQCHAADREIALPSCARRPQIKGSSRRLNRGVRRLPLAKETSYYPHMKVKEVIKLLEDDGWYLSRTSGSHRQFKHPTKSGTVTVSGKPSIDVPLGTLNSILKQAGLK